MDNYNIYQDIARRTSGDIYIGVVGPVRTGKSTFIKKFMESAVIPNIKEEYTNAFNSVSVSILCNNNVVFENVNEFTMPKGDVTIKSMLFS